MKFLNITIFILTIGISVSSAQVAVISNKSVKAEKISKNEILDFYSGDVKKWEHGEPVVVFDLQERNKVKETFYEFLGKSPSRMKSIWMKKLLSGEGDPPQSLKSDEEMLKKVAETPGALGFVNNEKVNTKVKVLVVIESKE